MTQKFLSYKNLQRLFDTLLDQGFDLNGPAVKNNSIQYVPINLTEQLPWGVQDKQDLSIHELKVVDDSKCFQWSNGASSAKSHLFKQDVTLWKVLKDEDTQKLEFVQEKIKAKPVALFGLKSCDLEAIKIQDKTLLHGKFVDDIYQNYRKNLFAIGVNCVYASSNCFCKSLNTGPEIKTDVAELILTEIKDGFLVEYISERAKGILAVDEWVDVSPGMVSEAKTLKNQANDQHKSIPLAEIRSANMHRGSKDADLWNSFMGDCTSCGTCTQVCPTCFCHKTEELPSFDEDESEHIRMWDSCFNESHGYTNGINHRPDLLSRYQMWMMHKFSEWQRQFGVSGCVGCGRCMSWCPVGIDVTDGVNKLCKEVK